MIDREKVIKGLECCSGRIDTECDDCPYNANGNLDVCGTLLAEDALELLKQIEKPKFFVHEDGTIEPLPKDEIIGVYTSDSREAIAIATSARIAHTKAKTAVKTIYTSELTRAISFSFVSEISDDGISKNGNIAKINE